jgi:hypothetical protein
MSDHTIESKIQSLIGKYFETVQAMYIEIGMYVEEVIYEQNLSIRVQGRCSGNMARFTSEKTDKLNIIDILNDIDSITLNTIPKRHFYWPVYKITGIKCLTFYTHAIRMEYPENKSLLTSDSMCESISFDVEFIE